MRFTYFLHCNKMTNNSLLQFVPKHEPVRMKDIKLLEDFLTDKPKVLVLTGAGISTESGIPDYRSEGVGLYARSTNRPVQHMEFIKSSKIRQRYWARNFVGWPRFSNFQPNPIHLQLTRMEREQRLNAIVTQNVDKLHTKAGSKEIIELHGNGYDVICLNCSFKIDRHEFQQILSSMNEKIILEHTDAVSLRPDGDVDIPQEYIDNFKIPTCPKCNDDRLKPNIIFFGDNVPRNSIERISQLICDSDGLLVLGSSLQVFSGYRIVLFAYNLHLPIAIVNIGETRGDDLASLKISAKCGDIIPELFRSFK